MRTLVIIIACASLLAFNFKQSTNWSDRKEKKMIRISISQFPLDLDPTKLRMMEHFLLVQLFSQTLVRVNESGEIVSYLAKRWDFDHKTNCFVFILRDDAKFSDGTPVQAKDVAWSFSRHFWKGSDSVVANYLKVALKDINLVEKNTIHPNFEIVNSKTISIHLKSYYNPFLHVLSMPGFSITKYGNEFVPLGSGPLKIINSDKNTTELEFKKNKYFTESFELNEVSVIQETNPNKIHKMFQNGEIDLSLGLNVGDITSDIKRQLTITPSESLATLHAYFNTKGVLNRESYRASMYSLLTSVADEYAKNNILFLRQKHFLPIGIMPKSYFDEHLEIHQTKSHFPEHSVKIVLNKNIFPPDFVNLLEQTAKIKNISLDIKQYSGNELFSALKTKAYDVVATRYVGNFPDPDAFIDSINSESPVHLGEFDSKTLFTDLAKHRFDSDEEQRLMGYADSFKKFERSIYIAPLFRLKIPIVHRNELTFPNTRFRYEGELWRIFWKK
ncbi:MAG: ABC transporter substrate-binding protein [Bdellovibrio sp.]